MSAATTTPARLLEQVDAIEAALARMDNLANALALMSRETLPEGALAADEYRASVEELAKLQAAATVGIFDAIGDVRMFIEQTADAD
jgi:hypothetical protein